MSVVELIQEREQHQPATRERFTRAGGRVRHEATLGTLTIDATVPDDGADSEDPKGAWWSAYLRGMRPTPVGPIGGTLRTVDLFCGPGGLANGVEQLMSELGAAVVTELAIDQDVEATQVYSANHAVRRTSSAHVPSLVDYHWRRPSSGVRFSYTPELVDHTLTRVLAGTHVVLAGPPCQGHSNLNNHTRRDDPRNSLYLSVPAITVAIGAPVCVIENVPAVLNDRDRVVEVAERLLLEEGYHVESGVISAADLGWPQTRKRHFLIARRDAPLLPLSDVVAALGDLPRSLWWAIGDLEDRVSDDPMDLHPALNEENRQRIDWLFDNHAFDLREDQRPLSHRNGTTYTAVYGRLHSDRPAPTITTGFMTPGRGRYVHPTRRRVLTAREAARLQGFPDTYQFATNGTRDPARSALAKWIGDAVPMPLGYAATVAALGGGPPIWRE